MVYASNIDPIIELVASGASNVSGRKIRLPAQTYVGETGDKHLTIVLAPALSLIALVPLSVSRSI